MFITVKSLFSTRYVHLWLENSRTLSNSCYPIPISLLSFCSPIFLFSYLSVLLSFCSPIFIFITIESLFSTRYIHLWLENSRTLTNSCYTIPISLLSFRAPTLTFVTIKSLFFTRYIGLSLENFWTLSNSRHQIPISAPISLFSYPSFQSS